MKKALLIFISILCICGVGLYAGITRELIVIGGEYRQGVKYNDELQQKVIAKLKEQNIKHIINKEGFVTFRKRDEETIKAIAGQFIETGLANEAFAPSKPNTYFYPEGANEYFIELLKSNSIPFYIDYDKNNQITKISWDIGNNKLSLEQELKVQEKIGQTKTPPRIQLLSPEMNDKFEKILSKSGIHFTRKGKFTEYDWKDWVEVEILKNDFYRNELQGHAANQE
jgi:hypothetical protein